MCQLNRLHYLFLVIFLIATGISIALILKGKEKENVPEWSRLANKYDYIPFSIMKEKSDIFVDGDFLDIYIVSDKLDPTLLQKPFLSGVYSWNLSNDNRLGILIPDKLGIQEVFNVLPKVLGYTFSIQVSEKKEKIEINEPLLNELLKSVEYVESDENYSIYTTN